jgi:mycothiol synthase
MTNNHIIITTKKGCTLRPFTLADAHEVVAIMQASATAVLGHADITFEEMLSDWTSPGVDLETTTRVLVDETGRIIGYCDIWDPEAPHVIKWGWVDILPELWDDALVLEMHAWVEQAARERIALAPEGARVILGYGMAHQAEQHRRLAESAGFERVRIYHRMQVDLASPPPQPKLDGFHIRPMDYPQEFEAAIKASTEGFRDHWGFIEHPEEENLAHWQHYIANDPNFDPSLWFLALDGTRIAGICFCKTHIPEDPQLGWVDKLAVLRPYRRRGLGMALLQHAFYALYQHGQRKVGLAVDAASLTDATRLYEKAGMHVVRQYDTYHKELRPGKDLTTQEITTTE